MFETGIYVRVSTEEQAQEGYSIRAQEEKLSDYARIKEWSIYKIYSDEGISGKNITERPAINDMIDDIKKGLVKNVLVFKIDRLTRNTADLIHLVDLFNSHDCAFNSLMESIDTLTASGRMFLKIIGIFAEFERENIVERTKLGFERKAKEGYSLCTRTASYGYDRKNGDKVQRINEYEAIIVKEIFDMFTNKHISFLDIARILNRRGIATKENSVWHARTVKNVLTNCNYVGRVRYATKDKKRAFECDGVHEPIITEELFDETQALIKKISTKSYTKRPKEEHYFSGILVCAKCGGKMVTHGDYKKLKDGSRVWRGGYRCSNYLKKTCNASNMTHKNVEKAFSEYISNFEDFNVIDDLQFSKKEEIKTQNLELINILQKKLKNLENKEREITGLYINNSLDFESYISIKKSLDVEKQNITIELNTLKSSEDEEIAIKKEDIIKNLKANWDLLGNIERRQFLVRFVDKIEIINEVQNNRRGIIKITGVEFSKD